MNFERNSRQAFFGSSAPLFAASAALTSVLVWLHVSNGTILAPLGGMYRWAKRYRKDVSADLRLREGETG